MLKIALCDDELQALDILEKMIQTYIDSRHMNITLTRFLSGEELLSDIKEGKNHYDAVYLDIKMTNLSGIETANDIREIDKKIYIVFVTALTDYVFDAFDVGAIHYLLKPIDEKKLFSTLDKITMELDNSKKEALVLHLADEVLKIPFSDIVYCEVLNHNLFIYEIDTIHRCPGKIDMLNEKLNEDFFRCHRSYIVNLAYVEKYKEGFIYLPSEEKIPVATRRRQEFMQALLSYQRRRGGIDAVIF